MLLFWKNWNKQDPKKLYALFTGLFFLVVLTFLIVYALGDRWALTWEREPILENTLFPIEDIQKGIFNITLSLDVYFVQEKFMNNDITIQTIPAQIWLGLFVMVWSWLLAQITYLKRWLYLAAVTIVMVTVVTFRIDMLLVYGDYSKWWVGGMIALNVLMSYFFFAFNKQVSLLIRWLAFLVANLALGVFLIEGAQVAAPSLLLANYGMVVPFLLSLFFIIIVSNEIPHLFLYLVARSPSASARSSLKHFTLITLIYLANLLLLFLRNAKILELDILYIDDLWILPISAIIGLWGVQKNAFFEKHVPFKPIGAGLYIGLAVLTFSCIGYASATMNTPIIQVYKDMVVYTHLAWGLAFLIYVLTNFYNYKEQQPIYEVTFTHQDDKRMPLYISKGMGYLIFTIILMQVDVFPYRQTVSGYYNHVADVHYVNGEEVLAELYYAKAARYDLYNNRTQFALAKLANERKKPLEAVTAYEAITFRDQTPQAYVNLSNKLSEVDIVLEAIYALKNGLRKFPNNEAINNNLALYYFSINVPDSAFYHLARVDNERLAQINKTSFWAKTTLPDSLPLQYQAAEELSVHINQYAIFNTNRKRTPNKLATALLPEKEKIDTINWQIAAYLYNYTLNQKATGDSSALAYINPILEEERNAPFSEYLLLAKACYYYYNQEVSKALDLLISVRGLSPELFNYVLGVWLIEAGDTEKAIEFLKRATFLGDTAAYYALAIALLEDGQWDEALENWNTILNDPEATLLMKRKAVEIQRINEATEETITRLSDLEKYGFIYYGRHTSVESAKKIINSIEEAPYQVAAVASLMQQVLDTDEWEQAEVLYDALPKTAKVPLWIQSQVSVAYLELLLRKRDYNTILSNIAQAPLVGFQENYRNFYRGAALVGLGKIQEAENLLNVAVKSLPFEEEVYIQQAKLYNQQKAYQKAYTTLVTGVGFIPEAADLWKAYAYQCLQVRLLSYAEDAQNKLKTLLSDAEYGKFEQDFVEEKQKVEEAIYSFGTNQ